jgi:integrase
VIIAARLQIKGGSFRDLPLTTELSDSLEEWFAFLESVKGVRLRTGGIDFAGSTLVFPGRDGAPFSNKAFNARLKLACERARVPVISAHPPEAYGRHASFRSVAPKSPPFRARP